MPAPCLAFVLVATAIASPATPLELQIAVGAPQRPAHRRSDDLDAVPSTALANAEPPASAPAEAAPTVEPPAHSGAPAVSDAQTHADAEPEAPVDPSLRATASERAAASELIDRLRRAEEHSVRDPAGGSEQLRAALRRLIDRDRVLATSEELRETQAFALVALVRSHLELRERKEASEAADMLLQADLDRRVPEQLVPEPVATLVNERRQSPSNAPSGVVAIACSQPCRAIVDGRSIGVGESLTAPELRLGKHRVWLEPVLTSTGHHVVHEVELTAKAPTATLNFVPAPSVPSLDTRSAATTRPQSRFPAWVGIVGASLGAAAAIAGASLIAVHGRCAGNLSGTNEGTTQTWCDNTLQTRPAGIATVVTGAVLLVSSSIALVVTDRRRRGRARR